MLITANGSIRELRVVGRDESELTFHFKEERLNPPVPDSLFRFVVPPGAEIVQSVEFNGECR